MPTSTRQQLVDAIVTRLKTITVANGYNLAIGSKVYDWRMSPLLPAGLPAIEVRDGEATMSVATLDAGISHTLSITAVCLASGATAAATARKGLADIAKALQTDRTFGGLAQVFLPGSTALEVQQDNDLLAAGQYTFSLVYYTAAGEI